MFRTLIARAILILILFSCVAVLGGIGLLVETKQYVFNTVATETESIETAAPFPVSVDPLSQTISNIDLLNTETVENLADGRPRHHTLLKRAVAFLQQKEWYQTLASPVSRIIVIWPGERREEVAEHIATILRWNEDQTKEFLSLTENVPPYLDEGMLYPGEYVVHRGATPQEVVHMIHNRFTTNVLERYTEDVENVVPLEDAIIIASLLEREASDFQNMREISGIIWNRLFIDMPLQLDATLQYAKANAGETSLWWPVPRPADKFISSPFNTYMHRGLPPGPIANPSTASILAALNPLPTDCLFYFHDTKANYYCSETYQEHVQKLKQVFHGR